jgi:hypothetical protein
MTDGLPTLSVGDIRIAPDGALWLATGEANTGSTAFVGSGVYRLANPKTGVFTTAGRVGGTELESTFIGKLRFDGIGNVYAATSRGVWRHAAGGSSGTWTRVLYPVPDPPDPAQQSTYNNICNDVAIEPNSGGRHILVNCAWRDGAAYNGFYYSVDGAASFARVNPTGALNPQDVGRTTFAYSSDGTAVYALVESMTKYTNSNQTALGGVYVSPSGNPAGPWNKIAGSGELSSKGSALKNSVFYRPGIQAWYNQFIDVDPADPSHVFVGLEEVYETQDGGSHWTTIGPYWNFDFKCWSVDPSLNTCPPTARCQAVSRCRAACRTTADRCCSPRTSAAPARWGRRSAATAATRSSIRTTAAGSSRSTCSSRWKSPRTARARTVRCDRCGTSIRAIRSPASSRRSSRTP